MINDLQKNLSYSDPNAGSVAFLVMTETARSLNLDNVLITKINIKTTGTLLDIIDIIKQAVGTRFLKMYPINVIEYLMEFEDFVVTLLLNEDTFVERDRTTRLRLMGSPERLQEVVENLEPYKVMDSNKVTWYYNVESKPQKTILSLKHKHKVDDAYYPFIRGGVEKFQQDYLNSSANVLLMVGDPGTGKSSFLRDMINRHNLSTAITYDEGLMKLDSFFIEFMQSNNRLLIIEDADTILLDRTDGNKVMNKLLNASDGLIETDKKIVFTANITNLRDVDEALMRPGRCFETLVFRPLHTQEASKAAHAAGVVDPGESCTLAKLFSQGPKSQATSSFGFAIP